MVIFKIDGEYEMVGVKVINHRGNARRMSIVVSPETTWREFAIQMVREMRNDRHVSIRYEFKGDWWYMWAEDGGGVREVYFIRNKGPYRSADDLQDANLYNFTF